jgi:hypothetical protein
MNCQSVCDIPFDIWLKICSFLSPTKYCETVSLFIKNYVDENDNIVDQRKKMDKYVQFQQIYFVEYRKVDDVVVKFPHIKLSVHVDGYDKYNPIRGCEIIHCKNVVELTLYDISNFDLSKFVNLKKLVIIACTKIYNLSQLKNLKTLWIKNLDIESISGVNKLVDLQLYNCEKIEKIDNMPNLTSLKVSGCSNFRYCNVPTITHIDISECNNVCGNFPLLKLLHITDCTDISNITYGDTLNYLKLINVKYDSANIDNLTQLKIVILNISIENVIDLSNNKNLIYVQVSETNENNMQINCINLPNHLQFNLECRTKNMQIWTTIEKNAK